MLKQILTILINALLFTIIIEVLFALILKIRNKKDILNIILVNTVTNPIVVLFPYINGLHYGMKHRYITLIILELLTLFFEGFIYSKYLKYKKINPYILSLLLNLASYLSGIIMNNIIY